MMSVFPASATTPPVEAPCIGVKISCVNDHVEPENVKINTSGKPCVDMDRLTASVVPHSETSVTGRKDNDADTIAGASTSVAVKPKGELDVARENE